MRHPMTNLFKLIAHICLPMIGYILIAGVISYALGGMIWGDNPQSLPSVLTTTTLGVNR